MYSLVTYVGGVSDHLEFIHVFENFGFGCPAPPLLSLRFPLPPVPSTIGLKLLKEGS